MKLYQIFALLAILISIYGKFHYVVLEPRKLIPQCCDRHVVSPDI
jgi:hypothetical protein